MLIFSAFVYSLAHPSFLNSNGFGFIAFFALIPVFMVIKNTTWKLVWVYGYLFGFVYYLIFNYWLTTFHPLAILIVPIIKGAEMTMLFLALKAATSWLKKWPIFSYITQAIIWVAYAYLSEGWFAGYPYGTIAYAIYQYRPLIQIASFSGIWLIIFMMILPQAFLGDFLAKFIKGEENCLLKFIKQKKNFIFTLSYAALFLIWLISGIITIEQVKKIEPEREWKVATIQHNHDSWKGGLATYTKNFNNLRRMTYEILAAEPDTEMVIWSETAFIPSVAWHTNYKYDAYGIYLGNEDTAQLVDQFVEFGKDLPVPLLTGNPEGVLKDPTIGPINEEKQELNRTDYNTVILFDNNQIQETYRKQHLVPFTEHFPYEKQLPFLYNLLLANDYNWWEYGQESVVFDAGGVKFGTPICFEDVFGYLPAEMVKNGANVIVNMTNDSWSGAVSAEMQHASIAVFRSIETRRSTIRGTNSGITCMITPYGKMVDKMEPFTMGWNTYEVPIYTEEQVGQTFYVNNIDLFAKIAVYFSLIVLALSGVYTLYTVIKKRKNDK